MPRQGVPVRRRFAFARCASHLRISVLQGGEYVNVGILKFIFGVVKAIFGVILLVAAICVGQTPD